MKEDKKIKEVVNSGKFAHIPMKELLHDLEESEQDIYNCDLAIKVGVTTYSGGSVQERLEKNKQFIKVINAEISRRENEDMSTAKKDMEDLMYKQSDADEKSE